MSLHSVVRTGTDSSGRPIWMSVYMKDWWAQIRDALSFSPVIVQGAWMVKNGGGANQSAGYHDGGGCLDIRTRDQSHARIEELNRVVRTHGAGGWLRDADHGGMDPHYHLVLGSDFDLDSGAAWQWDEYLAKHDGLDSEGRDYMWRPNPIVTTPPEDDEMRDADWERMATLVKDVLQAELGAVQLLDPQTKTKFRLDRLLFSIKRKVGAA